MYENRFKFQNPLNVLFDLWILVVSNILSYFNNINEKITYQEKEITFSKNQVTNQPIKTRILAFQIEM